MRKLWWSVAPLGIAAVFVFSGCVVFRRPHPPKSAFVQVPAALAPRFADVKDRAGLIEAAQNSLYYVQASKQALYTIGDRQVSPAMLAATLREFIKTLKQAKNGDELAALVADKFDVYRSVGSDGKGAVLFTSYYEPVFKASRTRTDEYKYPLYRRPDDLVDADLEEFGDKYKGEGIAGRVEKSRLRPYFSREQIESGKALEGRGLEIAWLQNRLDVMDLHIEGSARLEFDDGSVLRANYDGTNNLPFRGPMSALVKSGVLPPDTDPKEYVAKHPEIEQWLMATNPRYTFFKLEKISGGPAGTYGGALTAGRSIAVDTKHVPLGALAFVDGPMPRFDGEGKLVEVARVGKFALCQDTGGAIKGPGHIDYYAGAGLDAGRFASKLKHDGSVYLLLLKSE
ncbi:MAG: MltA domain-containing protein [Elusimicrobiales bacterium]